MEYDRKEDINFIKWARAVKEKSNYRCDICEQTGHLNSHHLYSWSDNYDLRYDLDNGVCLCKFHHDDFHRVFGKGSNTPTQYYEYKSICKKIYGIAKQAAAKDVLSEQLKKDLLIEKIKDDLKFSKE